MKRLALVLIALPIVANAQVPQVLSPVDEALQQRIVQLTGDAVSWQAKAIEAEREVADLQKQLADLKKGANAPSK